MVFDIRQNLNNIDNNKTIVLNEKKSTLNKTEYQTPIEFLPLCVTHIEIADNLFNSFNSSSIELTLYSPTWVIFAPNLIVDARLGIFTRVEFYVEPAKDLITDKVSFNFFIKYT